MKKKEIAMSQRTLIPFHSMLAFTFLAGFALPAGAATNARVSESYGNLPLQFEANRGQTHKDVRFLSRGAGYSLYLTAGETVLVLSKPNAYPTRDARSAQTSPKSVALRMSLIGAAQKPVVSGRDELPGKANYFIGKDRSKWRTNVPTYAKVQYKDIYPGVDLVYYGNQRQLEYDFVIAPGVNPKKIVLGFKGADKLEIDAQGELLLRAAGGDIRQHKPIIYQTIDGVRHDIAGGYVRKGANRVGFKVAAYDASQPLIIDPVVLSYSTYLGSSGVDNGEGIAVDSAGSAYITGFTTSSSFPTTAGAFQPTHSGGGLFVTKLDPTGSALVYSTFIGDGGGEGFGIAVDATGNAYVTGYTFSRNFPTTPGAFQTVFGTPFDPNPFSDAFVIKLDATGSALVYSTFLGGFQTEVGRSIAVDAAGNAYVTGWTESTDFPTTLGTFQPAFGGFHDTFVTKLNPAGTALVYSTFLGGSGDDFGNGIAVDAAGSAYVTGGAGSVDFPVTAGAFQPIFGGGGSDFSTRYDAFVTKLDPAGSALIYSTYLGGNDYDAGNGIAVDAAGNAYVTGDTGSRNFPIAAGAFQPGFGGGIGDAFVTKLDPTGSALVYSTYLGGTDYDAGLGIAVDAAGNAYLTGGTFSINFPTTLGAFQPLPGLFTLPPDLPTRPTIDFSDAFVTKLDSAGSALVYSSYLGGTDNDLAEAITVDANGNAYVSGRTLSTNFPTTAGAFQPAFGGGPSDFPDAFVVKIVDTPR